MPIVYVISRHDYDHIYKIREENGFLSAIKAFRTLSGWGLAESKWWVRDADMVLDKVYTSAHNTKEYVVQMQDEQEWLVNRLLALTEEIADIHIRLREL